jgi:selenocysteine-specific elongation factor
MKNVIVGTAGHIDHGKSRLVTALTGTDPDRLKEEKERGITIDIGFAFMPLGEDLRLGFVDVPGHEKFVKNMLAGIGGIDLVLLVVAADESVMPQTREHFNICRLLGVQRGLVVITKTDMADPEMTELVELEVREFLTGSFLEEAPLLKVSSVTGEGIEDLRRALEAEAQLARGKETARPFRLPVDRAFTIRGFGTVVTGTLLAGDIAVGEDVEIQPIGKSARVRGVEVHGDKVERAAAGQRTAINLHGVNLDEVDRGHLLGRPGTFSPSSLFDADLEMVDTAARPLKDGARVRFHLGTDEIMARVTLLDEYGSRQLEPGGRTWAQLRLERPTAAFPGDRFIIRQYSPVITIGGGTVVDNLPTRHRRRQALEMAARLAALAAGGPEERLVIFAEEAGLKGLAVSTAAVRAGLHLKEAGTMLRQLVEQGVLISLGENPLTVCPAAVYGELRDTLLTTLEAYHAEQTLRGGMPREELRVRIGAEDGLFRRLLTELSGEGRVSAKADEVALSGHTVTLSAGEEEIRGLLVGIYDKAGFTPPSMGDALSGAGGDRVTAEKIFHLLLREGELVRITTDLTLSRTSMEEVKSRLLGLRQEGCEEVTVGDVKKLFGLTRKFAIPLLEHLDRSRFTRRVGDKRVFRDETAG